MVMKVKIIGSFLDLPFMTSQNPPKLIAEHGEEQACQLVLAA